ncbi:hypothetical protein, partial [Aurantimonas marianensis]
VSAKFSIIIVKKKTDLEDRHFGQLAGHAPLRVRTVCRRKVPARVHRPGPVITAFCPMIGVA